MNLHIEQLHYANTTPSNLLIGVFSNIRRYGRRYDTYTVASNDASSVKQTKRRRPNAGTRLHGRSEQEKEDSNQKGFLSSEPGTYEEGAPGAKEASCLKHRNNVALQIRKILALAVEVEGLLERLHR